MIQDRKELLKQIMAVDFTLVDLNLYLNTHPYDMRTINLFNSYVQKSRMLRNNFERLYGPLVVNNSNGFPWQWIEEPWPWQSC